MPIQIHPVSRIPGRPDDTASVSGETIIHNGTAYDLSEVPEGGIATPEGAHPFVGPITREGGELTLGLSMAYDSATADPSQPTDPAHWLIAFEDGDIPDLVVRRPVQEDPLP